jgi:hypothetical protein
MKVVIIGGGAAGLMSATVAAKNGADVTLIEKNEKLGKKIYITGKGRCNVTNNCAVAEFLENVVSNKKFLLSALHTFSPSDTINFFETNGLKLKTERGNRVFPSSDKASDVTKTFEKLLKQYNVKILYNCSAMDFEVENSSVSALNTTCGKFIADKYILCTGGKSYPTTGSTGDGFAIADKLGHKIIQPVAGLIGLKADNPKELAGLTLKNVNVKIVESDKICENEFGELLFTHHGVSGPTVLTLSSKVNRKDFSKLKLSIDLKPALSEKELDLRIQRDFSQTLNKQFSNSLDKLLPRSLISVILKKSGISPTIKVNQITAEQRQKLVKLLKNLEFNLFGTEDISEAIITCGGIDVKEINPTSMRSKKFSNLYFAGEIIDVDALTGGFNLQVAFSTAYLAGRSCAE